jgi:hypothetical protein
VPLSSIKVLSTQRFKRDRYNCGVEHSFAIGRTQQCKLVVISLSFGDQQ